MTIATLKQKKAFDILLSTIHSGETKTKGQIVKEAGYGKWGATNVKHIWDSKGFKSLLDRIDDNEILNRVYDILKDDDKRSSLTAADMLLKLKNRYPTDTLGIDAGDFKLVIKKT